MYGPYDRSWSQLHWVVCINVWLRMTLTSLFNKLNVDWSFSIIIWSIPTLICRPKISQNINDYIFSIWVLKFLKVNAINVYHICSKWVLIICCLTSIGLESFCKHSIPQGCLYPLVHRPRILGCKHMEHKQIECSPYFSLHVIS
jgi:hypothetical protein